MVRPAELEELVGFVVQVLPPFELLVVEVEVFIPANALVEWPHELSSSLLEVFPYLVVLLFHS